MSLASVSFPLAASRAVSATRPTRPATARLSNASGASTLHRIPSRRPCVLAAATEEDDPLVESVERAAATLDLIIKETVEQVFVEEAVEEVIPGDGDDEESKASSSSPEPAALAVDGAQRRRQSHAPKPFGSIFVPSPPARAYCARRKAL